MDEMTKYCSIESSYYLLEHLEMHNFMFLADVDIGLKLRKKDEFNYLIQQFFRKRV